MLRDASELYDVVIKDLSEAGDRVTAEDTPYGRRDYVRSVFAIVDGMTHALKSQAMATAHVMSEHFEPDELCLLRGESYDLEDNGTIRKRRKQLRVSANFAFAIRCFVRACGEAYDLDLGSTGWANFRAALDVRHRITHPTRVSDFEITDDELLTTMRAMGWFLSVIAEVHPVVLTKVSAGHAAAISEK